MSNNKNLIGSILMAIAAFAVWGWGVPTYDQIGALKTTVEERQKILTERQAIIDNVKKLNLEYQRKIVDINRLALVVPEKKNVAEMVSTLEDITLKNGLQLVEMTVTDQKSTDTTSQFDKLIIAANLSGSYLSFLNFLDSLEKNLRLIDVTELDVSQTGGQQSLNFRVQANAYFLK